MSQGDIYQLKLKFTTPSQTCLNIFYYEAQGSGVSGAADLRSIFQTIVWAGGIRPILTARTTLVELTTINGMNNNDAEVHVVSIAGSHPSVNDLPGFIAVAFRNPPQLPGQRHSYKRFGLTPPDELTSAGKWDGSYRALCATTADKLDDLLGGVGDDYLPIQVTGGFKLGVPPVKARALNTQWQLNLDPSHQDTRQDYDWVVP